MSDASRPDLRRRAGSKQEIMELVREAKAGSHAAFEALADMYGPSVLGYMKSLARSHADAEDLAQDALVDAYRGLHTFREGTNFRCWLLAIAYHTWVHARRRAKMRFADGEQLKYLAAAETAAPDEQVKGLIQAAIAELPEEQRAVVHLRFGEEMSHGEIAKVTGANEATVRWRLHRARRQLQISLQDLAPAAWKK